jgi:hypothetical protein
MAIIRILVGKTFGFWNVDISTLYNVRQSTDAKGSAWPLLKRIEQHAPQHINPELSTPK